jgi:TRAP-type C4-dicarboxylate transport system permease small subunit
MNRLGRWFQATTDAVAAGMLFLLFATFLLQIVARYVLNLPLGWTIEVSLTLWLWLVLWGSAFCLRASDHVRFDIVYLSAPRAVQRVFSAIAALAILIALGVSWLPTLDYVDFYKIKRSSTLRIPLNIVFSVYMIFMTVIMIRYGRILFDFLRGKSDLEGPITSYEIIDAESGR